MTALRKIIEQTGAKIVCSSSWRTTSASLATLNSALAQNGLPICVDKTAVSHNGTPERCRAEEIRAWVAQNHWRCADGWVALDDMDLRERLPASSFVRTRAEAGLTDYDATAAVNKLGGPDPSLPPLPPPPRGGSGFNVIVTRGEMQRDAMRAAMAEGGT